MDNYPVTVRYDGAFGADVDSTGYDPNWQNRIPPIVAGWPSQEQKSQVVEYNVSYLLAEIRNLKARVEALENERKGY